MVSTPFDECRASGRDGRTNVRGAAPRCQGGLGFTAAGGRARLVGVAPQGMPMPYLLNLVYLAVCVLLAPWLLYRAVRTGRYRRGLAGKLLGRAELALKDARPVVWFHGVSVGEVHLLRALVTRFRQRHPEWRCVISTTTDTGYAEARKPLPDLDVTDWPFHVTW